MALLWCFEGLLLNNSRYEPSHTLSMQYVLKLNAIVLSPYDKPAMIHNAQLIKQGAEAKVYLAPFCQRQTIIKERFPKAYRHPTLDKKLTSRRVIQEARCLNRCQKALIDTPTVYMVDVENALIYMEYIQGSSVRDYLGTDVPAQGQSEHGEQGQGQGQDKKNEKEEKARGQIRVAKDIGHALGLMHNIDVVHGDLTTSNLMMREGDEGKVVLIDFGLSYVSALIEDKAVDLYVLERAFSSTHPNTEHLFAAILEAYGGSSKNGKQILKKLEDVRMRGRKRSMLG